MYLCFFMPDAGLTGCSQLKSMRTRSAYFAYHIRTRDAAQAESAGAHWYTGTLCDSMLLLTRGVGIRGLPCQCKLASSGSPPVAERHQRGAPHHVAVARALGPQVQS